MRLRKLMNCKVEAAAAAEVTPITIRFQIHGIHSERDI